MTITAQDAWSVADPTLCDLHGREACEHPACLPPDVLPDARRIAHESAHEVLVQMRVREERARREARRRLDEEERGPLSLPPFDTLRERLARPVPPMCWRVEGLHARHARVMLTAQFKAGKTTLTGNYIRCLVDGDPFLGRYRVEPVAGTVAVLDFEMPERLLDAWYRDQRIYYDDRVILLPMKGRAASFNLLSASVRSEWAQRFRQAKTEVLVLDCLRPLLDALGLDEHTDAGKLLVQFDALLAEAEISEALVVQHMGHNGERARGDSRLRDWPDAEWRLVRRTDDPASERYLAAYGRDVDIPESQLVYDLASRRLTIGSGSRRDAANSETLLAVIEVLNAAEDPLSGRAIKGELEAEHHHKHVDAALQLGLATGRLQFKPGKKRAKLWSVTNA